MNKNEIISKIYDNSNLKRKDVEYVVDQFIGLAIKAAKQNKSLFLRGYGTIKPVRRKGRVARNITTGESVIVPAKNSLKFIPSPDLIRRMNNGNEQ